MSTEEFVKAQCPVCGGRVMDIAKDSRFVARADINNRTDGKKFQGCIKCLRCKNLIMFRIDNK